ncbi:MAG TPA: hypothetical protein VFH68_22870 [Polyangia bacterium]|nr:hypothetical protein [Polyangia bacterium]
MRVAPTPSTAHQGSAAATARESMTPIPFAASGAPICAIAGAPYWPYTNGMRATAASRALVTVASLIVGCRGTRMTTTEDNKAFIKEMLGSKRQLTDYPDRFDPKITMHEPLLLPFGGDYQGVTDFQKFYPRVRSYYDFSTWELLGVHGDGDTVFATTRVTIANTDRTMYIAEQFTFSGRKLIDVRVHVCDAPKP